jgi:hypothetical protein
MSTMVSKAIAMGRGHQKHSRADAPIPAGATNLTIGVTLVGGLALIFNLWTDWGEKLLGENPSPAVRAGLIAALVGAYALVYSSDLLARGYASAHYSGNRDHATGPANLSPANPPSKVMTVSVPGLPQKEEPGWTVLETKEDMVLLVKKGEVPRWCPICDIRGE